MGRIASFFSLFTSASTLVCCALPALFVALGAGATFAGLLGTFPQMIWVSEHKDLVFGSGAAMLGVAGYFQLTSKVKACPPDQAEACKRTKDWSIWIYACSVGVYLVGAAMAFLPQFLS